MCLEYFNHFKKFISLSCILAKSEFKSKNSSSYAGVIWQIFNSLILAAVLWLVFSNQLGKNIPDYPVYLLIGVTIFNFFQKATADAAFKLIEWGSVIKSINFSYKALIFSAVLEALFSHLIEMAVLAVLFIFLFKINPLFLIFYPFVLLILVLFLYGLALILATLSAMTVDIGHFWRSVSPLLLFATPIFYLAENQPLILVFNLINPLYYFINLTREVIIYRNLSLEMTAGAVFFAFAALLVGNILFMKLRYRLVEKF